MIFRIILLALLLTACRTARQDQSQSVQALHSITHQLSLDSFVLLRASLEDLHLTQERYDSLGRLRERTTAQRITRDTTQATRQQSKQITHATQLRKEQRTSEQRHTQPQLLPTAWWLWVAGGVVVGIFVSIRFLKYRH